MIFHPGDLSVRPIGTARVVCERGQERELAWLTDAREVVIGLLRTK